MDIRIERIALTAYVKEMKKGILRTIEKAPVYLHTAVEMSDGTGERINYRV